MFLTSCLLSRYTLNGYRDDRDDIVQRRPTIRTENDNFILETPKNRNITLSPGPGGFVKIGNTIIGEDYQVRMRSMLQHAHLHPGSCSLMTTRYPLILLLYKRQIRYMFLALDWRL